MPEIRFESNIQIINSSPVIRIPKTTGKELPSRGMVMISGTINGLHFQTELEPDGKGSHWFKPSDSLLQELSIKPDEPLFFSVEPVEDWRDPVVPSDLNEALTASNLTSQWNSITPRARWEWIRWIRFTNNPKTRARRIEVTCSKLSDDKKRPCCFDLSRCTDMTVCKSGVLASMALLN